MEDKILILQAIKGLKQDLNSELDKSINSLRNDFNQKLDTLLNQLQENTQILKALEQVNITGISDTPIQRRSQTKVKVSVTQKTRNGSSQTKPIFVKVDYDPEQDFAILAFKRKMARIWKF